MENGTFRLIKSETCDLTPELVQSYRALEASPTERELNTGRVKMLRDKAAANYLISFNWAKAKVNGKWVRVNGQHSTTVLEEMIPNGFPTGLKVHIDEYEVGGFDGLAVLFRQFDERKSGRSAADVAGAYQNITPELRDVARPIGKLAVDGISWYRQKVEKSPTPRGDEQYSLFHEVTLHDFIIWANQLFSIKTPELLPVAVVAAMYATFSAHPDEAKRFWESVARGGDQYDDTAATTVLDEWLKTIKENRKREPLTPAQVYQGCIYAYNAARKGQALKGIKYDFKVYPEPLGFAA